MTAEPFTKVTIILETGDNTTKITIPQARNVVRSVDMRETEPIWPSFDLYNTPPGAIHFSLSGFAEFSQLEGHVMREENVTTAKEVEE